MLGSIGFLKTFFVTANRYNSKFYSTSSTLIEQYYEKKLFMRLKWKI